MHEFRKNVLSIDGGGIRGIIPAMILAKIEEKTGENISCLFDLIVGTSTGGILALGLTQKGTPEKPLRPMNTEMLADLLDAEALRGSRRLNSSLRIQSYYCLLVISRGLWSSGTDSWFRRRGNLYRGFGSMNGNRCRKLSMTMRVGLPLSDKS